MGARRYCYEDGFAKAFLLFSDEIEKKRATERKRRQATAAYDPAFHQPFLYPRASPPKLRTLGLARARPRTTRKRNKGSACMSPASPRFIALACVAPARPRPPAVAAAAGGTPAVLTTRKSAAPRRRRTEGAEEGGGRGEEEKREREEEEERGGGGGGKEKGCSIENVVSSFLFPKA